MSHKRADVCGQAIEAALAEIRAAGTYKRERVIVTPQSALIRVQGSEKPVVCFCANNYLGLCDNRELVRIFILFYFLFLFY